MAIYPTVDPENISDHNALIVDAMAVVHAIKGKWKTFGEFADAIFVYLVKLSQQWNSTRLDFVSDRYPEISIKNAERTRKAVQGAQKVHILNKDQCVPKQRKKYLSCGKNKEFESLIESLRDHWSTYVSSQLNSLECLYTYITSKDECHVFRSGNSEIDTILRQDVPELHCDHEEADTRLLIHSKHTSETHDRIIVKTPDTDVFVVCTSMQKIINKNIYMMTGIGNKFCLIDTQAISEALGEKLYACLPGFHAFTGTVSYLPQPLFILSSNKPGPHPKASKNK